MERRRSRSPRAGKNNRWTGALYSPKYQILLEQRKRLPITDALPTLKELLETNQVVVIQGETGSGKTTQVPQYLVANCLQGGAVACTQPRRVAAMSVARRVAEEMDVRLGDQVGYSIRFEDNCSPQTILKYLTDGMLLREAMSDPMLSRYRAIVLDEAHERTLATDILFGLIKELLPRRPDLKLVVMSATLDTEKFQRFFPGSPLLKVPGRMFRVDLLYLQKPETDYVAAAVRSVVQIHAFEPAGDILLFMTGEEEIEQACKTIKRETSRYGESVGQLVLIPLYSSLPPAAQQKIFDPAPPANSKGIPGRKCIIATNIAETSVTIDGVVYVVDTGLSKQKVFNPRSRVESLQVAPISKASARQRAGRAGRTRPGKCYRLYTEATYNELEDNTIPEVLRANLASVVLSLKTLHVQDLVHFDWLDPPSPETLMRALENLNDWEALDDDGELTDEGHIMSEFPLSPDLAKVLIGSAKYQCCQSALTLVAMLSSQPPFLRPRDAQDLADRAHSQFVHKDGDHLTLITVFDCYQEAENKGEWCAANFLNPRSLRAAGLVRDQLREKMEKLGIAGKEEKKGWSERLRKCVLYGGFLHLAHQERANHYQTLKEGQVVALHPSTTLLSKPEWVLYFEYVFTSRNYIRTLSPVEGEWLLEVAPKYFGDLTRFPQTQGRRQLERLKAMKRS